MAVDKTKGEEKVEVTVAPRHSIHQALGTTAHLTAFGPGKKCYVPKSEVPGLIEKGFIVDPNAKKLTDEQVEKADVSDYVPGGNLQINEKDVDQKVSSDLGAAA